MNPPKSFVRYVLKENRQLKALSITLAFILSTTLFSLVSTHAEAQAIRTKVADLQQSNTELAVEYTEAVERLKYQDSYEDEIQYWQSRPAIDLADHVAQHGFRGVPVIIMNNQTPYWEVWNEAHPTAAATYSPKTGIIRLREKQYGNLLTLKYLQHEYGHHLWNRTLSDREREIYKLIYALANQFTTEYSLTDAEEDFADTYAYYKLKIGTIPEARRLFMEKLEAKYKDEF